MIITFLIISVVFNIFLIWYVVQLLKRLLSVSDSMEDFFEVLEEYKLDAIESEFNTGKLVVSLIWK